MRHRIPRRISALEELFTRLRSFAEGQSLDDTLHRDLAVMLEELFTNQVRHGGPGSGEIGLSLDIRDGSVVAEITDDDVEPFDPTRVAEVDTELPAAQRERGGLGLHFVRQLSDSFSWDYDSGRRRSRITITRRLER